MKQARVVLRFLVTVAVVAAGGDALVDAARAQVVDEHTDDTVSLLAPKEMSRRKGKERSSRQYTPLFLGGWMVSPSVSLGAVFDDNLFQRSRPRVRAAGAHFHPSLIAERDTGLHHTRFFASGDFNIYPSKTTGNTESMQIGVSHEWEAQRDFVVRMEAEADRQTNRFVNGAILTPRGLSGTVASPQRYNQFSASLAGVKSFNHFFAGLSSSVNATTYDTLYTTSGPVSQRYRDGAIYSLSGRLGYAISPSIYAFVEPTGNVRQYNEPIYNSKGYRVVAGAGLDRNLFRGEAFAGYQVQAFEGPGFSTQATPVIGGKLFWYPTRAWTITASLDETYQDSGLLMLGNPLGGAARMTAGQLSVAYAMSRSWTASLRAGFSDLAYIAGSRHDRRWNVGATLGYRLRRNLDATFEYTFVANDSNAPAGDFSRNQFMIGATYRY